jgi:addiction module HigA family antidote
MNAEDDVLLDPVVPGEILQEEYLVPRALSQVRLAEAMRVSPNRIAEIVHNRRRITADTALRLGLDFRTSPEFWPNLQTHYNLEGARVALTADEAREIATRRVA